MLISGDGKSVCHLSFLKFVDRRPVRCCPNEPRREVSLLFFRDRNGAPIECRDERLLGPDRRVLPREGEECCERCDEDTCEDGEENGAIFEQCGRHGL